MSGTAENTDAEYSDADFAEYVDELDAIANDPTLTDAEKQDAIDTAIQDELAELSAADTVTATEAGVDAATANLTGPTATAIPEETTVTEPTTVSDPTTADLNERLDNLDAAIDDLELPNADVVGDPTTASYGTTTAASAPAAEPAPVTEPAPVAEPASAAATTAENASIGVDGNVDYYSPRDVDRDGNVDVIHSRVDGVDTITHVDDNGEITLVEQDLDFNGTYETAAAARPGGTVRVAEDTDDDGDVDLATFYNETGERFRQDNIDGARITETKLDTDGDGDQDVQLIDTDGDGRFDTASLDTDSDGYTNEELIDVDGDGRFDVRVADDNGDGTLESTLVDTVGDGCLGDISTYESLIPADDGYHTQAGTDVYEAPATDSAVTGDLA